MDNNMYSKILIKNGNIADTLKGSIYKGDLYIKDGIIEDINDVIEIDNKDITIIDASGFTIMAGLVDMHVHLRDPGFEEKETIESGARAALSGGITSIACMPNTSPVLDSPSLIKYVIDRGKETGCNIYPVAAMTAGLKGENITEMGLLSEAGAVGFSDDGKAVGDEKLMFEIMRYSKQLNNGPLILHEEVQSFSKHGLMHEGNYSTKLGLEGISSLSDDLMIGRDIALAKASGARIHITHISTRGAVEMIRQVKAAGLDITCDVTAHHLFFNDSHLEGFNTNLKVKPPIRDADDQKALIEGVADGTIDAIVSDHAPHLDTGKNTTFKLAEFGTTGVETLLAASYSILCKDQKIGFEKVAALLGQGPAKIIGIDGGVLRKGACADIAAVDLRAGYLVKKDDFISRSKNSAFIGQKLYGKIIYTISNGKIVYESGLN